MLLYFMPFPTSCLPKISLGPAAAYASESGKGVSLTFSVGGYCLASLIIVMRMGTCPIVICLSGDANSLDFMSSNKFLKIW